MRYWILSGSPESWNFGLSNEIWGVRENLKVFWDRIRNGDIAIFYVTQPISGIIGFGKITKKFSQYKAIWNEEIEQGQVIYPYKFNFKIVYALPKNSWISDCIKINELKINYRMGINPCIDKTAIRKVLKIIDTNWGKTV